MSEPAPLLELQEVSKTYAVGPSVVDVFHEIDLQIHEGDLLSITGQSGCGKSTLMNILGLLDRPTDGEYIVQGKPATGLNDNELSDLRNRSIGFVFQQFHLLPRLSALENVGLPLTYRGIARTEINDSAMEALENVEMATRAAHLPGELSGGQQQRVAIARALVGDPAIVLADEPTGALDEKVGQEILQLFLELNSRSNLTLVIVTHDAAVAKQCRRRTHLDGGSLLEDSQGRM